MSADKTDDEEDFVDRWTDPETLLEESVPGVEEPTEPFDLSSPTVDSISDDAADDREALQEAMANVDDELLSAFVVTVLLVKIAVLLIGIGIIFVGLAGRTELGGILLVAGCLVLFRAAHYYRKGKSRGDAAES